MAGPRCMNNRCPFQISPIFSELAMVLKYFFLKDCSQNTYILVLILTLFNAVLSKQLFSGTLSFLPVKCSEYLTSFISFTCIILIYQRITASFWLPKFFTKYILCSVNILAVKKGVLKKLKFFIFQYDICLCLTNLIQ